MREARRFAAFCGELRVGWLILEAPDPEAKGALERSHRFMHTNFEPGRSFANELDDYQLQLDAWCDRVNARVHRATRAVVSERLAEERCRMRPLPARPPDPDRRFVIRVAQQPYLRFDTNDYSFDPRLAGRRVEVRISQSEVIVVALDTRERACRHRRRFARHLTFTDPAHGLSSTASAVSAGGRGTLDLEAVHAARSRVEWRPSPAPARSIARALPAACPCANGL